METLYTNVNACHMKKYIYVSFYLLVSLFVNGVYYTQTAPLAKAQINIPNITPYWIKRQSYDTSANQVLSKLKQQQAAQDSSKSLFAVAPSVAGGAVIALGSVLAWIHAQKRKKVFKKFMEDITTAEKDYSSSVLRNPKRHATSLSELKKTFLVLEEKADLSAANKNLDEEQRTTISNTIQRKLEEIEKTI